MPGESLAHPALPAWITEDSAWLVPNGGAVMRVNRHPSIQRPTIYVTGANGATGNVTGISLEETVDGQEAVFWCLSADTVTFTASATMLMRSSPFVLNKHSWIAFKAFPELGYWQEINRQA